MAGQLLGSHGVVSSAPLVSRQWSATLQLASSPPEGPQLFFSCFSLFSLSPSLFPVEVAFSISVVLSLNLICISELLIIPIICRASVF